MQNKVCTVLSMGNPNTKVLAWIQLTIKICVKSERKRKEQKRNNGNNLVKKKVL